MKWSVPTRIEDTVAVDQIPAKQSIRREYRQFNSSLSPPVTYVVPVGRTWYLRSIVVRILAGSAYQVNGTSLQLVLNDSAGNLLDVINSLAIGRNENMTVRFVPEGADADFSAACPTLNSSVSVRSLPSRFYQGWSLTFTVVGGSGTFVGYLDFDEVFQ